MKYTIRDAQPDDGERIYELTALISEIENLPPPKFTPDVFKKDCFGHDAILTATVAVDEKDFVIGHVISCRCYDIQDGCHKRYIADLCVDATWRNRGVGSALLASVCALAVQKNEPLVFWNVDEGNKNAIHFYEKLGGVKMKMDTMCFSPEVVQKLAIG